MAPLLTAMTEAGVLHPNGALSDKPHGLREFAVLDLDDVFGAMQWMSPIHGSG